MRWIDLGPGTCKACGVERRCYQPMVRERENPGPMCCPCSQRYGKAMLYRPCDLKKTRSRSRSGAVITALGVRALRVAVGR